MSFTLNPATTIPSASKRRASCAPCARRSGLARSLRWRGFLSSAAPTWSIRSANAWLPQYQPRRRSLRRPSGSGPGAGTPQQSRASARARSSSRCTQRLRPAAVRTRTVSAAWQGSRFLRRFQPERRISAPKVRRQASLGSRRWRGPVRDGGRARTRSGKA